MKKFYFLLLSFLALSLCANAVEKTVTFTFSDPTSLVNEKGVAYGTTDKFSTGTKLFVNGNSDVLFEYEQMNKNSGGFNTDHIRVYSSDIFYVKINDGVEGTIKSVSFVYTEIKYKDDNFTKTVSEDNKKFTYTHTAQNRYTSMTVVYDAPAAAVEAPEITVTSTPDLDGQYYTTSTAKATIACVTEGASIQYAITNGEDPTTWSDYSDGVDVISAEPATKTLWAKAVKDADESAVVKQEFSFVASIANTKETALTTAQAIALIDATSAEQLAAEKVYVKGVISKIDSYNSTYKSITYWLDNNAFEV